ncbi:ABC transporter permease [Nitrospirota bacterium]
MNHELRHKLDLIELLVRQEFAIKFKRTSLGFLWSLINPLMTAMVLFFAFKVFMRFGMDDYALFLLTALFPWTWFTGAVAMSANTLISNMPLIKKVIFPKQYLLLSVVIVQMINFLLAVPIILLLVLFYGHTPGISWLYGIPILTFIQFFIVYGLTMIVSITNAYFRDMEHLITVLLSLLFWMTPIIYPLSAIPPQYQKFLVLNPMMSLVNSWRNLFLHNTIDWKSVLTSAVIALVVYIAGVLVMKKLEKNLDEVL